MERKVEILNVGFNPSSYNSIIDCLLISKNRKGYVCFPDLYNIVRANEDKTLMHIYNNSTLTLPDGTPSKWLLKLKGYKHAITISGYWLCKELLTSNLSHYFYGTTEDNLKLLRDKLSHDFPDAKILGYKSPPYLQENQIKYNTNLEMDVKAIMNLKPDIIWVGISSPKQDILMYNYNPKSEGTIMIGVGAVLDYFAGTAFIGPEWIKKIGLRWILQLFHDPGRYLSRIIHIFCKVPILLIKGHL